MREIKHLSVPQWLRSAIPDSQQPSSPIGFLFLKLPPPPCAVLLVDFVSTIKYQGCQGSHEHGSKSKTDVVILRVLHWTMFYCVKLG